MESRMMQDLLAQKIRTRRVWKQRARLAALASALGLIALAGMAGGVAQAQDSPDSGLWGSMLKTLGIGGENNIEYRERPPLVVPPTRDLPPPQTTARARDPNWGPVVTHGAQAVDFFESVGVDVSLWRY